MKSPGSGPRQLSVPWPPAPSVKLAVNPVTNKVYAVNETAGSVSVLNGPGSVIGTIPTRNRMAR